MAMPAATSAAAAAKGSHRRRHGAAVGHGRHRRGRRRQRLEREREVAGRLEPLRRVLLEAPADDAIEGGMDGARRQLGRLGLENGGHGLDRGVAAERPRSREHLVQHGAEREDVRPEVRRLAAHLLGRHVSGRSEHRAGNRGHRRHGVRQCADGFGQLRQAEVEDLHPPVGGDEDVLGLEIAMHDAALVRGGHAAGRLRGDIERDPVGQRAPQERRAERLAFEELRHDVGPALVDPHVEHRQDVGMAEGGGGQGFLFEAQHAAGVARQFRRQHLEGDVPLQAQVVGAVDHAHPAGADHGDDLVRAEARSRCQGQVVIIPTGGRTRAYIRQR